ncbi:hypothetical protein Q4519_20735 [Motilimonas sp. 1_MG-2023]|uniref:hypothetical protein n=1 Tax=Motilimonas sp. 1_MG-2023 TaxID=3062672 RepID=UPI0026E3B5D3|nr:hypothetical protein [Motilimonas sp. 1_MG-2023]MDO6528102.1 hypothetical protein [Motilimonas sp. 1_MG-2023]
MKPLFKHLKYLSILTALCFGQATFASVEEGLALLQQDEIFLAIDAMQTEIDAEDPEALFWQARIYMSMGGMERFEIGRLLLRSAEQGYPWAMINLVESDYEHCRYFMLPCDDKWLDKAIEKWQELAANGDGKAMYMLAKHKDTWRKYVPYLAHRTRVAQYEQALEMGANRAAIALYNELSQHQDIKDPAIREQALGYLTTAAERGYAPAMVDFYNFEESLGVEKVKSYLKQATNLGYGDASFYLAVIYEDLENKTAKDWEIIYKYAMLARKLDPSGRRNTLTYIDFDEKLSPSTIAKLDQQVANFLTKVKPNRFYDETNLY